MKNFSIAPRSSAEICKAVSNTCFNPDIVIDVGVATGTPWLYRAFPNAIYHLVEPNKSFAPYIERHLEAMDRESRWHTCAAGIKEEISFLAFPEHGQPGGAQIVNRGSAADMSTIIETEVKRIDSIVNSNLLNDKRVLLKTDCQGFDCNVIYGASGIIGNIDCIIAEISLISSKEPVLKLFSFLSDQGFVLFDIADPLTSVRSERLAQFDACFMRANYV